jgi:glycosyltransferase involved in cell wall biosynthesis
MPLDSVSVIIPTYNRAGYLARAIESALAQTVQPLEVLVVDDGSTDDTPAVIQGFDAASLRMVRQEHSGAPVARNLGISEARGDFILWLDSDDELLPECLEIHAANLARRPDLDVSYGDLNICDKNLEFQRRKEYEDWYGRRMELLGETILDNKIPNPGALVHKDRHLELGGFDESFTRAHDYEFWTRLIPGADVGHAGSVVCNWRWHSGNMSTELVDFDTSYEVRLIKKVLDEHSLEELYPGCDWTGSREDCLAAVNLCLAQRFLILKDALEAFRRARMSYSARPNPEVRALLRRLSAVLEARSAANAG